MFIDILIILALILLNGVFAMTELAVVSSRKSYLLAKAAAGSRGAKLALELKRDPSKFLSTIQIGITLIGILSGAYSGTTIAEPLGEYFSQFPSLGTYNNEFAILLVVSAVTYVSLIIGELVPKQIALRHADAVAVAIAVPILWLSKFTKPLVYLLDISNKLVLAVLGIRTGVSMGVSAEEVKAVIAESTRSGALEPEEKLMLDRVMRLDDITVAAAMTHRKDIVWLDSNEAHASVLRKVQETRHSRYLLCNKTIEKVLGLVVVKDLLIQLGGDGRINLSSIVRKPLYLPESTTVLEALEEFKQSTANLAIIVDEYGDLQGIVTLKDIMEAIVGTLPEPAHREDYSAVQREDGSWLVDGGLSVHKTEEAIGLKGLASDESDYTTVAGFLLHELRHIPHVGDAFDWQGWRFEVVDMDGTRVDKVLITPPSAA